MSRRALVSLLLVAAGFLLPFALVGLWTQQVLLDRERFTNLSDDLLDREAVRQGIADAVLTDIERTQPVPAATEPAIRAGINGCAHHAGVPGRVQRVPRRSARSTDLG